MAHRESQKMDEFDSGDHLLDLIADFKEDIQIKEKIINISESFDSILFIGRFMTRGSKRG